jgi:hypothetical protein
MHFESISIMKARQVGIKVLKSLLQPIIRLWLRHGHSFREFTDSAKTIFVSLAEEELAGTGAEVNISRISIITGIRRSEIERVKNEAEPAAEGNLLTRVVGHWRHDRRFASTPNNPRVLTYSGPKSEFKALCNSISQHLNPGTVLFELERKNIVERKNGKVMLLRQMNTVQADLDKGYQFISDDVGYLLQMVEENLFWEEGPPNLHIRTEYDNIYVKDLPEIKQWLVDEGKQFHRKAREFLSQHDQDVTPGRADPAGAKVIVQAFSLSMPKHAPRK